MSGMVSPLISISIALSAAVYLGTSLFPLLLDASGSDELPFLAAGVQAFAEFVSSNIGLIALTLFISIIGTARFLPAYGGTARSHIDRLPLFRLYRTMQGITFLHSLSAIVQTGRPLDKALDTLAEAGTPYIRSRLDPAIDYLKDGRPFPVALRLTDNDFPDREIIADMQVAHESGTLSTSLGHVAERWTKLTMRAVAKDARRIGMIATVLAGSVIILTMLALVQASLSIAFSQ